MATLSLKLAATRPFRYRMPIRVLHEIGRFFASIAAAHRATADFEKMNKSTDAELAGTGMKRGDIPRVVFHRHFDQASP